MYAHTIAEYYLTETPFPFSFPCQLFLSHPFEWHRKTHTWTHEIQACSSLPPSFAERREGEKCSGGRVPFQREANSVKSGLSFTKATWFIIVSLAKKTLRPLLPQNPNDIEKNTALQYLPVHPSVSSQLSHRQTNVHFNVPRHVN